MTSSALCGSGSTTSCCSASPQSRSSCRWLRMMPTGSSPTRGSTLTTRSGYGDQAKVARRNGPHRRKATSGKTGYPPGEKATGSPSGFLTGLRSGSGARTERTVRGRPGRLGLDRAACRFLIKSRCQRSTVSGRTSSRIRPRACRLSRCSSAASRTRSQDRERVGHRQVGQSHQHSRPSCRDDRVAVAVPAPYRATKPGT